MVFMPLVEVSVENLSVLHATKTVGRRLRNKTIDQVTHADIEF